MKKTLPYLLPEICGYGQFSILLGILDSQPDRAVQNWFAQSYIQLIAPYQDNGLLFAPECGDNQFMNSPFLDHYIIPRIFFLKGHSNLLNFVRECIDQDTYVGFLCDRYYLPFCHDKYQKHHQAHFILITGYDDTQHAVLMADYFNLKYSIVQCPTDCLFQAFSSDACQSDMPFEDSILCVRRREMPVFPMRYDPERVIYLIRSYLHGDHDENTAWGLYIYDALQEYVREGQLQYNAIQTIYDHKIALCRRLRILRSFGYAPVTDMDETYFDTVRQEAFVLRNCLIRQRMHSQRGSTLGMCETIQCILDYKETDRKAMKRLLEIIYAGNSPS